MTEPGYVVIIADNFHYMDEAEFMEHARFDTYEAAEAACIAIVERSLAEYYTPGMTSAELISQYTSFGEDPFIRSADRARTFSARSYASKRSYELCDETAPSSPTP